MKIRAERAELSGTIQVPGSKSHTIRALLLAALSDGTCNVKNPLCSADCLSTAAALPLIGAEVDIESCADSPVKNWIVKGAGKSVHLPSNVVDVGDSGSLLYFLSPIAATFEGWSVFTGDASIRTRPVHHVAEALNQLGAQATTAIPGSKSCPLIIKGPISPENKLVTGGTISSQYISGMMMAALRMKGTLEIELTDPKETPYLTMTQKWLEKVGVKADISPDFHHIKVTGPADIKAFDTVIPSDWEGVAFPLVATLITDSQILIEHVDSSGTQGDDEIVNILKQLGADIEWNREAETIVVRGQKKAADGIGRLTTENLKDGQLHVNLSGLPDAICAVAVAACFTEGTVYIEDIAGCRRKETDRIKVMVSELSKLGAELEEGEDYLIIHGHSPLNKDGSPNPDFKLHGTVVESYGDHRVAMSLSCLGLGLPSGEFITVKDAECCSVSFPDFYKTMNRLNAGFVELNSSDSVNV
ncbi:3-phosphoshikimate 1-carboxyvinyltransferase [Treponema sp.]|uniref:3-phosphoshikimate 1-carboxyvinyltransferase n=1 Tax=Treponema sp. TaxID=166 RepID=UPI0025D11423|nr:3-phosphoshikimate 1-carboxyvinyltransferase [Treponema sp.]MCR5218059.1 3-phosphoshikimate 1-carboxyvinyltransferase [Treponema sp.]